MEFAISYSGVCMEFGNSHTKFWHLSMEFSWNFITR